MGEDPARIETVARRALGANRRLFGLRRSALLELLLFFGAFFVVEALFGDGTRFRSVALHPFWIAVLLMSIQYGVNEGLLTAGIATAFLLVGNLPPQTLSQDLYAYILAVISLPLMWFPTALILGSLRTRQIRERDGLATRLEQVRYENETLAQAHKRLSTITSELEKRLAGQRNTALAAMTAARHLLGDDLQQVLRGAKNALHSMVGAEACSLFLLEDGRLEAAMKSGWSPVLPFHDRFESDAALYRSIVEDKKTLCVNNLRASNVLEREGLLAAPLLDPESGDVLGMLKIELMEFIDLNDEALELFQVLGEWVGAAVARVRAIEAATADGFQSRHQRLLSEASLEFHLTYFAMLEQRFGLDVSMIVVTPDQAAGLTREDQGELDRAFDAAVRDTLRDTDIAFECERYGPRYAVVLVGTSAEAGRSVCRKLALALKGHLPESLRDLEIGYRIV